MKKNTGIILLLASFVITTIGSFLKIMHAPTFPDIFLGIGMITFVIAFCMIIYQLVVRRTI